MNHDLFVKYTAGCTLLISFVHELKAFVLISFLLYITLGTLVQFSSLFVHFFDITHLPQFHQTWPLNPSITTPIPYFA